MIPTPDATHDPALLSWVESANAPNTDFPPQNLPFGVFRGDSSEQARIGIAIGDSILDLDACVRSGLLGAIEPTISAACQARTLNALCALGPDRVRGVRAAVSALLRADTPEGESAAGMQRGLLLPMSECTMTLPADIGDYSDFYASIAHATNVGSMFRPDNPLLPNYKWIPIGYHGRASSIVPSGALVRRPFGQTRADANTPPSFGAARSLDYEIEVGAFVGVGNTLGNPVPLANADEHVFGLCLMNDWSARDIQSWEYQPLGPFLAKSFATTISPWVVTLDALAPFRIPAASRPGGDPRPLPYLEDADNERGGGYDITLEVWLLTGRMRTAGLEAVRLTRGSLREMYWTFGQLLAHHTSNGCNLRAGDLIGSGTVSGASKDERGCLLELTWRGQEPITLSNGELRTFLEDGDEVIMRGWCDREGYRRIGFGECRGVVVSAESE